MHKGIRKRTIFLLLSDYAEYAGSGGSVSGYIFKSGVVSGKNLSEHTQWDDQGNIRDDRTYVVTAIENADGTPRPLVSDEH